MTSRDLASIAFRFVGLLLLGLWLLSLTTTIHFLRPPNTRVDVWYFCLTGVLIAACAGLVLGGGRLAARLFPNDERRVELGAGIAPMAAGLAAVGAWFGFHYLGRVGGEIAAVVRHLNEGPRPDSGFFVGRDSLELGVSLIWSLVLLALAVLLVLRARRIAAWWDARRRGEARSGEATP